MPPKKGNQQVKRKAAASRPQARTRRPRAIRVAGMDAGARAHRSLLLDPCNAPLSAPVYAGLGSGQYRRSRRVIAAEGASVEGCYVFQLGTNTFWNASHVSGTAGTNYTFSGQKEIITGLSPNNNIRVIAGCVKVRYIGAESSRAGTIGLLACPGPYYAPFGTSNAQDDITYCPVVNRTGEVQHEVKFVPNSADEQFALPTVSGTQIANTADHSSLMITYRATPATTIQLEVTVVYEVEASNNVINSCLPPSGMTLNQVLRSLGPVAQWAYGHVVAPTIRSMAGRASGTVFSTAAAASRAIAALAI